MSLEEIKEAIRQLSALELAEFTAWFEKFKRAKHPHLETSLRPFGLSAGEFTVPDDFDAPLPEEILREFEPIRLSD